MNKETCDKCGKKIWNAVEAYEGPFGSSVFITRTCDCNPIKLKDYQGIVPAYKLVHLRKNGTLGPLFINRRQILPIMEWMEAEDHPTPGYAHRPGWHVIEKPNAPHLSMKGRVWVLVEVKDYVDLKRPESQGGVWWLAKWMRIIRVET